MARLHLATLLLLSLASMCDSFGPSSEGPSCLDDQGNFVSWWFMYKTPNGHRAAFFGPHSRAGTLDPTMSLSDQTGPLLATLNQLKGSKASTSKSKSSGRGTGYNTSAGNPYSYLLYNDEPDNAQPSSNYGHCKGVLGVGDSQGFWLSHSTPLFPNSNAKSFTWDSGEDTYGQTFICMSLDFPSGGGDVETAASHMLYIKPNVYEQDMSQAALAKSPSLSDVVNKKWVFAPGTWHKRFTPTSSSMYFDTFGKNTNWNSDLWGDLVAPFYKSGLVVESWIRGQALGPYCSGDHAYEVVDAQTLSVGSTTFKESQDHAKWAITTGSNAPGKNHSFEMQLWNPISPPPASHPAPHA